MIDDANEPQFPIGAQITRVKERVANEAALILLEKLTHIIGEESVAGLRKVYESGHLILDGSFEVSEDRSEFPYYAGMISMRVSFRVVDKKGEASA
jgi:hypothetical protein